MHEGVHINKSYKIKKVKLHNDPVRIQEQSTQVFTLMFQS